MRVLALHFSGDKEPNACQIYRANMPLHYLGQQQGWQTSWEQWSTVMENVHRYGKQAFIDLVNSHDVFVFPRMVARDEATLRQVAILFRLLRGNQRRIVYEIDDDYTNKARNLEHLGVFRAIEIASWADAITVTTLYLAELMRKETRRPVHVLPNMLDPGIWRKPEHRLEKDFLVVGLSGSVTHQEDWRVLETVMPRILANDYGIEVRFRVTGFHPDYLANLPRTDYLPAFDYANYAELVRSCDIILAPVVPDDGFNKSKSPIKVLEGMGASRIVGNFPSGAACIATRNLVYSQSIEHGKTGLLVDHTPDAWYQALDELLRNEAKRHQIQQAGHAWVWKRHDISKTWMLWASAYHKVAARPVNPITLPYAS